MFRLKVDSRSFALCWLLSFFLMGQNVLCPVAAASPAQDEDFGIWNTYDLEKKLNKQWKMKVGEELRFREHNGLYYAETHVGADYKPVKYCALGLEYQEIRASKTVKKKEQWYWESVPRFYVTPQTVLKGFLLEDRNMLEFRWREESKFSFRYRNRAGVTAPWKWTPLALQPYTENEIFFENHKNGLVEDRFFAGFKLHWWGPLYGSIYYLRHSTKNTIAKWKSLNVLGTGLKISF